MSELLRWGAATDVGRVRDGNEDAYLAEPMVFAVADGMGGHQAGEVASAMAVDVLRQRLSDGAPGVDVVVAAVVEANAAIFQTARRNTNQMGMGTTVTVLALLPDPTVTTADPSGEIVADVSDLDATNDTGPTATGPTATGPTATGPTDTGPTDAGSTDAESAPDPEADSEPDAEPGDVADSADAEPAAAPLHLAIANVGDSRTYLLRNGELSRITIDHSYVQELLATGLLSEDEARNHPRRNIVTRALGIEPSVRVDSWMLPLVRGDRFVLCSDGLVDEIDDQAIVDIVDAAADPQTAADQLVAAALEHGGRDNVTVIVIDVVMGVEPVVTSEPTAEHDSTMLMPVVDTAGVAADPFDPGTAAPAAPRRQLRTRTFLLLLAIAVVVTAVVTLVAVALNGDDAPAPTTTTSTTSTTTVPTTTRPSTSTTVAPATTTAAAPTTVGGP